MSPFNPVGDRARWRILYDLLEPMEPGQIITYETMGQALNLDPIRDRHNIQTALRRAAKEFEEVDKHAIRPVPNTGYRVVHAPEHLELANSQQLRAGKSLVRARSKVVNVDLTEVALEMRANFQVAAQAFAVLIDTTRRLDTRNRNLEQAVASLSERTEEEVADLKARLARVESLLPEQAAS